MKKNKMIDLEDVIENLKEISKTESFLVTKENRLRFYELRDYLRPYLFWQMVSLLVFGFVLSQIVMFLIYVFFEMDLVINSTQVFPVGYELSKEQQGVVFYLATIGLFFLILKPFNYLWVKFIYKKIKKWSEKSDFDHNKRYKEEESNSKREAITVLFERIDSKNFRQPDIEGIEAMINEGTELFQKRHTESIKEQADFLRNEVGMTFVD